MKLKIIALLGIMAIAAGSAGAYKYIKNQKALETAQKYAVEHVELTSNAVTQYAPSMYSQMYAVFAKRLNQEIKNLRVIANKANGTIEITFDYPSGVWYSTFMPDNILVQLYDKNGNLLTSFLTAEAYAPADSLAYYSRAVATYQQMGHKTAKILPTGNSLEYSVNLKDLEYAHYAEVGFHSGVFGLTFGIRGKNGEWKAVK